MKRYWILLVLLLGVVGARADGPDDQYISVYNLMQEADKLVEGGQIREALPKYLQAQSTLQRLQKAYPDWNTKMVSFRLTYLSGKVNALSARVPAPGTNAPAMIGKKAAPVPANAPPEPAKAVPGDWENQLATLNDQVRQLQADKAVLEAKLKEAFAVQPASVDPRELAKVEEKLKLLQKENDLLKVTLDEAKAKAVPAPQTKALEEAKAALKAANSQLAEQGKTAAALAQEKQERETLQARVKTLTADVEAAAALRTENELLKKQVADLRAAPPPAGKMQEAERKVAEAKAQIAALQSEKEVLQREKSTLEAKVRQLTAAAAAAPAVASPKAAENGRIKLLEKERNELQKQLAAANKELFNRKSKAAATRVAELELQLTALRARLDVYEARQVPYTAEELNLFKEPVAKLAPEEHKASKAPVSELPPGTVQLVAEAQRYYANRQLDQAEAKYLQVLKQSNTNVPTLANLAAIELDLNHYDAAEINIKQAVALAPEDPYSLFVLGRLRFAQKKYDEAVDALSRAAKLDPQDAQIQNFLGLALSEKGLRQPAEAAFRKAVQLEPNYANAHNNLAVYYIMQQPPYVALARWHYQRALAGGQPRNAELEKMLDAAPPAGTPK